LIVVPEGGPAGPKHAEESNKLTCPKFILLCVMCWFFKQLHFLLELSCQN